MTAPKEVTTRRRIAVTVLSHVNNKSVWQNCKVNLIKS